MNQISITGRLTAAPELTYTNTEKAICKFSVAVDRRFKNSNGEKEADFFSCVAWQKTAEFVANYLDKGRLVEVTGRMEQDKWVDKESGQNRSKFILVADNVGFLGPKPDAEDMAAEDGQPEPAAPARAAKPAAAPPPAKKPAPAAKPQSTNEDEEGFFDPFADG